MDRHPNLRVAYVAQHAFHHLEEHLDISPNRQVRGGVVGSVGSGECTIEDPPAPPPLCLTPGSLCGWLHSCTPHLSPHTTSRNPRAHNSRVLLTSRVPCCLFRYILRRYSGGEDREESSKVHRVMTQEEWEKVKKQV